MTPLQSFARQHRLRIRLDECGDPIIPGRRGHSQLYFADSDGLCLMVLDGPVVLPSRWKQLGGKLWLGDVSRLDRRRVQDVKITNIPLDNAKLAILLARVKTRRVLSESEVARRREWMAKLHAARRVESSSAHQEQNKNHKKRAGTSLMD